MNEIIILGHENPDIDSIFSGILLERILKRNNIKAKFIIPDKNINIENIEISKKHNINIDTYKDDLDNYKLNKVILVDHHERNINNEIIQIIDHHPVIDNKEKEKLNNINYTNIKSCSTTCIIGKMYEEYLTKEDFILILVSALVDTASFHSNKTVDSDIEWLDKMCKNFNINIDDYYEEGLCLTKIDSIKEASLNGLKKHNINNLKVESSYIQIKNKYEHRELINKICEYLKEYLKRNNLDIFVFIVQDMESFKTAVYKIYKDTLELDLYDEYTSRGNNIIPYLKEELEKKGYQKVKSQD
jgi:inorganic pyrophosphatase/exopolyphosphatase